MIDFITGNKFKNLCHYSFDEFGFVKHIEPDGEKLKIFVKIDLVSIFFDLWNGGEFILVTHNGDTEINSNFIIYLSHPNLIEWYGQNVNINHPKLKSIPIGIANETWEHGNEKIFLKVIEENYEKDTMVYANFDVNTNSTERNKCIKGITKNGVNISDRKPFKKFLEEISKSYFVVSPNGNGIDCHKTWESIYLGSIPIVTDSINIKFYKDLPIYVINDWSDFTIGDFSESLYKKIWGNFDREKLNIRKYVN
jgi:hypothetical protein